MDRIKRLSFEILEQHKSSFGENFSDNKKNLDQFSIIRSKGLKNEIAGYITKFIKREIRDQKAKEELIAKSKLEETLVNDNPDPDHASSDLSEPQPDDIPESSSDGPKVNESLQEPSS